MSAEAVDQKNAIAWAYNIGKIYGSSVVILGSYDQHKLETLKSLDPQLAVHYVQIGESSAQLVHSFNTANDILNSDFYCEVILKNKPMVLTDRKTWGENLGEYTQAFAHLTGRSLEGLRFHLSELGVDIKALPRQEGLYSIKDVIQAGKKQGQATPALNILGELIR